MLSDPEQVFAALADPTRREIVSRLAYVGQTTTVSDLAKPFAMSLQAISKHIKVLEEAGLLIREVKGRIHNLRLNAAPLQEASAWIGQYRTFWEEQPQAQASCIKNDAQIQKIENENAGIELSKVTKSKDRHPSQLNRFPRSGPSRCRFPRRHSSSWSPEED